MARPNPRFGDESCDDPRNWVTKDGYTRNLCLEEKLERDYQTLTHKEIYDTQYLPPHWLFPLGWKSGGNVGDYKTDEQAINYLENSFRILKIRVDKNQYAGQYYPRDPAPASHAAQWGSELSKINNLITQIKRVQKEKEFVIQFPDILPPASAEEQQITAPIQQPTLSNQVTQIINDINNNVIQVPDWFKNNIQWVQSGQITEQEFLTAYNYLVEQQITDAPITNKSITDNMITQKIDHFTIENGRAIGQITFTATQNFNPFYYNKNIVNIIQFKDRNGANILTTVKQNNLRFTATERDETIQYDEGMNDNIYSKASSFVVSNVTTPRPFSKQLDFEIREKEPVKPISSGFMAAGVAGAIAGLVLLGFIVDSKVGK